MLESKIKITESKVASRCFYCHDVLDLNIEQEKSKEDKIEEICHVECYHEFKILKTKSKKINKLDYLLCQIPILYDSYSRICRKLHDSYVFNEFNPERIRDFDFYHEYRFEKYVLQFSVPYNSDLGPNLQESPTYQISLVHRIKRIYTVIDKQTTASKFRKMLDAQLKLATNKTWRSFLNSTARFVGSRTRKKLVGTEYFLMQELNSTELEHAYFGFRVIEEQIREKQNQLDRLERR